MPVLKRPARNSVGVGVAKRPASNAGINDFIAEAKKGTASEGQGGDDDQQLALRDKGKAEKFAKLLKAGAIPPHIAHMWQVESKKQPSSRQYQTHLVNSLMVKNTDGSYSINTTDHMFEEYRKVFVEQKAKETTRGMPRGVFLQSYFHGNQQALNESISKGEVLCSKDEASGVEYLSFREVSLSESKVNQSGEMVKGAKKLKQSEAKVLAGLMSEMKWQWALKQVGEKRKYNIIHTHTHTLEKP